MAQTWLLEAVNTELKTKAILTATEKGALANTELVLSSDKMVAEWFQKKPFGARQASCCNDS